MSWQCSTGNCSFPEAYGTLGFCSSCEDWSDRVIIEETYGCITANGTYDGSTPLEDCQEAPEGDMRRGVIGVASSLHTGHYQGSTTDWLNLTVTINWTQPLVLMANTSAADVWTHFEGGVRPFYGGIFLKGATPDAAVQADPFTGESIPDCNKAGSLDNWRCQGYGAAACNIQPCVRVHRANINGGQLQEEVVAHSDASSWGFEASVPTAAPAWIGVVDTQCVSEPERDEIIKQGYAISASRWLPFNLSHIQVVESGPVETNPLMESLLTHGCLYIMDWVLASSLISFLFIEQSTETITAHYAIANKTLPSWEFFGFDSGSDMLTSLYNNSYMDFDSIQEAFSNVSDIATAWVRTRGNTTYSTPVTGDVLHYATCLHVDWVWLLFPATLGSLAVVFFFVVVISTGRDDTPIWKLSLLAWIMRCRATSAILDDLAEISIAEMEGKSKEFVVEMTTGCHSYLRVKSGKDEITD